MSTGVYRLELILGQGVTAEAYQMFLAGLDSPAGRILTGTHQVDQWREEKRPGRVVAWVREFDTAAWAAHGTPMLLALIILSAQPYAAAWQALGQAAAHPDAGMRLVYLRPNAPPVELYRLP